MYHPLHIHDIARFLRFTVQVAPFLSWKTELHMFSHNGLFADFVNVTVFPLLLLLAHITEKHSAP